MNLTHPGSSIHMTDLRVFVKLLLVMMSVSIGAIGITAGLLYIDATEGREKLLIETANRYRRALTSVVEYYKIHAVGEHSDQLKQDENYILKQITKIIKKATSPVRLHTDIEIAIALKVKDELWFLTRSEMGAKGRFIIKMGSNLAIPMQLAFQGKEGTIRNRDFRGDRVIAAYTRIKGIDLGIVAKSNLKYINLRFLKEAAVATLPAIILVLLGAWYFWRTTNRFIVKLREDGERHRHIATKLDEANKNLAESEQRLKCFFDAAFEGIAITKDGLLIDGNDRFSAMFGYTSEEMIGMPVSNLMHEEDLELVSHNMKMEYTEPYEHRSIKKDGNIIFVEVHAQQSFYQGQSVRVTAIHDLTAHKQALEEVRRLEAKQRQSSKLEAIGSFASGIAHDFNNALQPIIGNCDLLSLKINGCRDSEIRKCLANVKKIMGAAETAQLLVRRMQTFTRREADPNVMVPLKIDTCMKEAFEFLRSIIPTSIDMEMDLEVDLGQVSTTDVMIRQVMMNLVKNSAHAIGDEAGRILINVTNETIRVERWGLTAGEYVRIEIEDDGCGMPDEVLERALDPYYTTKDKEGTGLGLAVVQGILESHKGLIHLQSTEGLGTKVSVYLPTLEGNGNEKEFCDIEDLVILGNNERILFVDDEKSIVQMAKDVLTSLQYDVTVFTDSKEAFREFCKNPSYFDALMTDLTMPGMTGIELIREVKIINPEIKVVLSSGFGSNGQYKADLHGDLVDIYMQKPITRRQYSEILRDLFA
jgi:PAS domain S-box-containing protein